MVTESFSTLNQMGRRGTTTTNVKNAKQHGMLALNSDLTTETTTMTDIVNVIIQLARMQGQAIDRAQAEALNTAVEKAHDKWQNEQKDLVD